MRSWYEGKGGELVQGRRPTGHQPEALISQRPLKDAPMKSPEDSLVDLPLQVLPGDGNAMGNQATRQAVGRAAGRMGAAG